MTAITKEEAFSMICVLNSFCADRDDAGGGNCPPRHAETLRSAFEKLCDIAKWDFNYDWDYFDSKECTEDFEDHGLSVS